MVYQNSQRTPVAIVNILVSVQTFRFKADFYGFDLKMPVKPLWLHLHFYELIRCKKERIDFRVIRILEWILDFLYENRAEFGVYKPMQMNRLNMK